MAKTEWESVERQLYIFVKISESFVMHHLLAISYA